MYGFVTPDLQNEGGEATAATRFGTSVPRRFSGERRVT
jgi:hypothetical protein